MLTGSVPAERVLRPGGSLHLVQQAYVRPTWASKDRPSGPVTRQQLTRFPDLSIRKNPIGGLPTSSR